ncbi:MAG: DUF1073 domain-containing protein [Planctomycetota bacterium]|jgi:phage-related protein (TIGR01555 family)|nr:DUF1073 domain-containing protein [Planctomycetota bacterium]
MGHRRRKSGFPAPAGRSRDLSARALNSAGTDPLSARGEGDEAAWRFRFNPFVQPGNPARTARIAWSLYAGDWAAQKIVDIPVFDMFREGWNWRYRGRDTAVDRRLQEGADRLGLAAALSRAKRLERLLGGAVVVLGVEGAEGSEGEPLAPEEVGEGGLRFLNPLGRDLVSRVEWQLDPSRPGYGRPEHYHICGKAFHRSRLAVFDGNPISPRPGREFPADPSGWDGFGLSVFAPLHDALLRAEAAQDAAIHLVRTASVWTVLKKGLKDLRATREGRAAVDDLRRMAEEISLYRGFVVDGEDVDLKQHSPSFGSVPELLAGFLQVLSAASDIPATRFLGEAPGGLNSDGNSSLENYYNAIRARQRLELEPVLRERLLPILVNSVFGTGKVDPGEIGIEWLPLWNPSRTEEAAARAADARTVIELNQAGLLDGRAAADELAARKVLARRPDRPADPAVRRPSPEEKE